MQTRGLGDACFNVWKTIIKKEKEKSGIRAVKIDNLKGLLGIMDGLEL